MRALAAAYAIFVALALPALLWAADDPPVAGPEGTSATPTTPAGPALTGIAPADAAPAGSAPNGTAPAGTATGEPASADPAATPSSGPGRQPAGEAPATDATGEATAGEAAAPAPRARAAGSNAVTIRDFVYSPATVTVNEGDTVTWTNQDTAPHTATADDGSFDTGNLSRGQNGSHTFDEAGRFSYICTLHPQMKGTVVVRAASSGGGADSNSGSETGSSDTGDVAGSSPTSDGSGSSNGSSLPATGLDVAFVALAGLALIGGGALLRRRLDAS